MFYTCKTLANQIAKRLAILHIFWQTIIAGAYLNIIAIYRLIIVTADVE